MKFLRRIWSIRPTTQIKASDRIYARATARREERAWKNED